MKKISVILGLISFMALSISYAYEPVWRASHTATADSTQILCKGNQYLVNTSTITNGNLGILHAVCVNDAPSAGTIAVYDSSSTATNPLLILRSTAAVSMGCMNYDIQVSSGLVYTTSAANDVTFLFTCF